MTSIVSLALCLCWLLPTASAFSAVPSLQRPTSPSIHNAGFLARDTSRVVAQTKLNLFDKMFEEEGPLGKGITVGKVQVALDCINRGEGSIFALLEKCAANGGDEPYELAQLTNSVCLALMRKSDEWVGACSDCKWFKWDDAGKAESLYNDWANREAAKFEKEYVPPPGSGDDKDAVPGGPTTVVVSIILEIQGDTTKFEGAGFSIAGTKDVLSSIASDVNVDGGECLNAAEVFWTPSDKEEVLTKQDLLMDFPEIIDL